MQNVAESALTWLLEPYAAPRLKPRIREHGTEQGEKQVTSNSTKVTPTTKWGDSVSQKEKKLVTVCGAM
jgi:hypothetical protein